MANGDRCQDCGALMPADDWTNVRCDACTREEFPVSGVEYVAECDTCPHSVTNADREALEKLAREHSAARPGHQVSVWRVHWPDGGRDFISSIKSLRTSRPITRRSFTV